MKRRNVLLSATLCGLAAPAGLGRMALAADASGAPAPAGGREFYELRRYGLIEGQEARMETFVRDAAVPAWNRAGASPVGVFREVDEAGKTLYALLTFRSLDDFAQLEARLAQDAEYLKAGAGVVDAPKKEPAYVRIESSLLLAFTGMPRIAPPELKEGRIFEMRIYESSSAQVGHKKVEMFNEGGEIGIFHKAGLRPVFFGQALAGAQLPNLTYMLTYENMDEHKRVWDAFKAHPEWKALSGKPEYKNTVSKITSLFLRPLEGSQI